MKRRIVGTLAASCMALGALAATATADNGWLAEGGPPFPPDHGCGVGSAASYFAQQGPGVGNYVRNHPSDEYSNPGQFLQYWHSEFESSAPQCKSKGAGVGIIEGVYRK